MKAVKRASGLALLMAGSTMAFAGSPVEGRWDAQLVQKDTVIPFRLDIAGDGQKVRGTLYDGFRPYEYTTSASYTGGKLVLNIEHYLTTITATEKEGKLIGDVVVRNRGSTAEYQFVATRHDEKAAAAARAVPAPSIAGSWEIPLATPSSKGEKAFRFIVEQRGAEVAGAILRVDGDTGAYSGTFKDGKWVLAHYDGSRPGVLTVTPKADGTLDIVQGSQRAAAAREGNAYESAPDGRYASSLTAYRSDVARAKGFPEPANHLAHTTVRDRNEKFVFNFPDTNGKLVNQDDPFFKGKVIVAIVTGTWCPNCHDEAQYLVELDKKYRDQGLSIVALNFEEVEQQESQQRAKAFIKQYGVKYPYLLAGAPEEMWEKVPQLLNLNTWPATVFIGRDGTVRAVHAGFASNSTGDFRKRQDQEFQSRIEGLLAEKAPVDQRVSAR